MKRLVLLVGLLGLLTMPRPAFAGMILGQPLFATGGAVTAQFMGHSAAFSSDLYLYADDLTTLLYPGVIFNNHTTPPGTQVNLGTFASGTELVFAIFVHDTAQLYFMGGASRNPDGIAHGAVDNGLPPQFPDYGAPIPAGFTGVGFEDIFGGGDADYDDLGFAFSSVRTRQAPEPASLALLGLGLVGAGIVSRRRG